MGQPVIAVGLAETVLDAAVAAAETAEAVEVAGADSYLMWEASSGGLDRRLSPWELQPVSDCTDWFRSLPLCQSHPQCISTCYR